jgi:hypothetical protein
MRVSLASVQVGYQTYSRAHMFDDLFANLVKLNITAMDHNIICSIIATSSKNSHHALKNLDELMELTTHFSCVK